MAGVDEDEEVADDAWTLHAGASTAKLQGIFAGLSAEGIAVPRAALKAVLEFDFEPLDFVFVLDKSTLALRRP